MKMGCANSKVVGFIAHAFFIMRCDIEMECTNSQVAGFMSLIFFFNNKVCKTKLGVLIRKLLGLISPDFFMDPSLNNEVWYENGMCK